MGHATSAVVPVLCLATLLLVPMGCTDQEPTVPPPQGQDSGPPSTEDPIVISGWTLEGSGDVLARESEGSIEGEIPLWVDERLVLALRIHTPSGDLEGFGSRDSITLRVCAGDPANLEVETESAGERIEIRLRAHRVEADSLQLQVIAAGDTIYTSRWIQVAIDAWVEVHGLRLRINDTIILEQTLESDTGPLYLNHETVQRFEVVFLDGRLQPIPPAEFGDRAHIETTTGPTGVFDAALDPDRRYSLRLERIGPGVSWLQICLVRAGREIYRSRPIEIHVVISPWVWFDDFEEDNAPDGPVLDLAVHDGSLIIGGAFNRVGPISAPGIARWDGEAWHPMGTGLVDVRWVLVEDDLLVAGGPTGGFFRWTGEDWEPLSPPYSPTGDAVLYQRDLVVLAHGSSAPGNVYRRIEGEWLRLGPADTPFERERYQAIAIHGGNLLAGVDHSTHYGMPHDWQFLGRYDGTIWQGERELSCIPSDLCSSWVGYLGPAGASLVLDWSNAGTSGNHSYLEVQRDGEWQVLGPSLGIVGTAALGEQIFLVNPTTVYRNEGTVVDPIAEVAGGELRVAEAYQGRLYVGGSFTRIEATPSYYIGCYGPR